MSEPTVLERLHKSESEVAALKHQVKDLHMRLFAIKTLTLRIDPICADKLAKLLESCEGCNIEETINNKPSDQV